MLKKLSILIILFSSFYSVSQEKNLRFKHLNTDKGLSNNWVNSIVEDNNGLIWIGSRSGLNYFDGSKNTVLNHKNTDISSLTHNDISKLIYAKKLQKIVAGTWGGGINLIDPFTKEVVKNTSESWTKELIVKGLAETENGEIIIGTYGKGFYNYNGKNYKKCTFQPRIGESIDKYDYCQDLKLINNKIWFCSRSGGIGTLNEKKNEISSILDNNGNMLSIGEVTCISSYENIVYLGTQIGDIYTFNLDTKILSRLPSNKVHSEHLNRINSISFSSKDIFWISSSKGIHTFNLKSNKLTKIEQYEEEFTSSDNFCSFIDHRGIIWLGNWGGGVNYYSEGFYSFHELDLSNYKQPVINSIIEKNDSILYLGSNYGIIKYNVLNDQSEKIEFKGEGKENINENLILGLNRYNNQILIAVDAAGIYTSDDKRNSKHIVQNKNTKFINTTVTTTTKINDNELWIGSWANGAVLLTENPKSYSEFIHDPYNENSILSNTVFCATKVNNETWIGTMNGISVYDSENKKFHEKVIEVTTVSRTLKKIKDIRAMEMDNNGDIWISNSLGLVKYNLKTNKSILISEKEGLLENVINNLIITKTHIWATTKSGLTRINLEDLKIKNYTIKNGLSSNNFVVNGFFYSKEKELLYLSNGNTVICFNPNKLSNSKIKPMFSFEHFLLNDDKKQGERILENPFMLTKKLILDHDQSNIAFEIGIQDYYSINGKFAYKLDGFDKSWVYQDYSNRQIRYTNVASGNYKLLIAAVSENGQLIISPSSLEIIIKKPFWETWWFIMLASGLFLSSIVLFYWLRINSVEKQNKVLEQRIHARTLQVREQNQILKNQGEALHGNLKYASLLQNSLMSLEIKLIDSIKNYILYRPKDIVSGDFYWSFETEDKTIIVVADCTGHGVSGAFMSILGITSLRSIVEYSNVLRPDLILNALHKEINDILRQDETNVNDGMDISIICYHKDTRLLEMSSAMNSIIYIKNGELVRVKGNRFPIGGSSSLYNTRQKFDLATNIIDSPTKVYLFTDGFQDQIGEKTQGKYMQTTFRDFLLKNSSNDLNKEKNLLEVELDNWMGSEPQIDDILVIGLEIMP